MSDLIEMADLGIAGVSMAVNAGLAVKKAVIGSREAMNQPRSSASAEKSRDGAGIVSHGENKHDSQATEQTKADLISDPKKRIKFK